MPVLEMIRKMPRSRGTASGWSRATRRAGRPQCSTLPGALRAARSSRSSIVYSSSTIWWKCTAIWRTAANSARSSLPSELMFHLSATSIERRANVRIATSGHSISCKLICSDNAHPRARHAFSHHPQRWPLLAYSCGIVAGRKDEGHIFFCRASAMAVLTVQI